MFHLLAIVNSAAVDIHVHVLCGYTSSRFWSDCSTIPVCRYHLSLKSTIFRVVPLRAQASESRDKEDQDGCRHWPAGSIDQSCPGFSGSTFPWGCPGLCRSAGAVDTWLCPHQLEADSPPKWVHRGLPLEKGQAIVWLLCASLFFICSSSG